MIKTNNYKTLLLSLLLLSFIGCDETSNEIDKSDKNTTVIVDSNISKNIENNNSKPIVTPTPTLSYALQNYYADALDKEGVSLKSALHTILSDSAIYLTYAEDYEILAKTDRDFSNFDADNVILFYLQTSKSADERCHSSSKGCWNREHMWPKSLGVGYDKLVNTYTDLHHLRPSDAGINSFRGNKPYGEARTPYVRIDGFYADETFEVSDDLKGNVARAIFYMMVRYEGDNGEPDLEIYAHDFSLKYPAELCTMLRWNRLDTVTMADKRRNDIVQQYQGNRNPFVDDASWADDIWGWECK